MVSVTRATAATARLRKFFFLLVAEVASGPAAVPLVIYPGKDEDVEEQEEAAYCDGHGESRGVALVVAGCQLSQQVVVVVRPARTGSVCCHVGRTLCRRAAASAARGRVRDGRGTRARRRRRRCRCRSRGSCWKLLR